MVACGHQLGSSDDSDWLLSSSASAPVGGSTNTTELLHSIMADRLCDEKLSSEMQEFSSEKLKNNPEFLQSRRILLSVAKEREGKYWRHREGRIALRRSKVASFHDFSGFDEEEHLDGCPVKWLFRRQSTESWRSGGSKILEGEDSGPTKNSVKVRDKTPREIQVRKMGLKKRQTRRPQKHKIKSAEKKKESTEDEKSVEEWKQMVAKEERRAKLAAKLNFRPFDTEHDDLSEEEITLRDFLYPRPLTGQRPWLCVLLAPRLDTANSRSPQKRSNTQTVSEKERRSPTMTVRSLVLPEIAKARPVSSPLGSSAARWAGQKKKPKTSQEEKMSRSPHLLTIKLRGEVEPSKEPNKIIEPTNPLLEEDRYFRLRRFLNLDEKAQKNFPDECSEDVVKKKSRSRPQHSLKDIQIVSSRVHFFERPGKPMR